MDKNIIIRRLQSARHLLSDDDDRINLDCCRLALGNIEDALAELEKNEAPTAQEGPERPSEAHTQLQTQSQTQVSSPPSSFAPILSALSQSYRELSAACSQYFELFPKKLYRRLKSCNDALLYAVVGLKPGDTVIYKGAKYIVESVSMSYQSPDPAYRTQIEIWLHRPSNQWLKTPVFFPADESERSKVYVTMHKPRCSYRCMKALFDEKEEIIKQ